MRDLAVLAVTVAVAFVASVRLDAFEALGAWSRRYEGWHVDEVVVALAAASWVLALHSWRRRRVETAYAWRLEQAQSELERAGQTYRSLFSENPHIVFSLDLDGNFAEVNPAGERLSGYTEAELTTMNFVEVVEPAHLDAGAQMFLDVVGRVPRELELAITTKQGGTVELHVTGVPIMVDDEVVGVYGIAEDIGDRNRMLRDLEHATAAAEAANEAKSFFLANMSHEIRTPLTSILAARELLEDTDPTPVQTRLLDTMDRAGVRLRALIESILDYSRIEAGVVDVDRVAFDVRATVAEVAAEWKRAAAERGLSVLSQVADDVPATVVGDGARVGQVLCNLLGNAVKFTEHGTVGVAVSTYDAEGSDDLLFEVSDTGIGIEPEHQASVFESFMQVDPTMTRRHEGSGLGLAICRELVTAMGGEIGVRSTPGEGSTFFVRLPLRRA